jgi:flagellar biosynthesis protein FliR
MAHLNEFIETLNQTLFPEHGFKSHLLVFVLIVLRLVSILHASGLFHAKHVPNQLRLGFIFLLTFCLWPYIPKELGSFQTISPFLFSLIALREVAIGFLVGYLVSAVLVAAQTAGDFMDIFRGANQIQLMSPDTSDRVSALSSFLHLLCVALFFSLGMHEQLIGVILESFNNFPFQSAFFGNLVGPRQAGDPSIVSSLFHCVDFFAFAFQMAVQLAMPVIIIALIIEIGFGLINRAAPQINAYFLSLPAKSLVSIIILLLAMPLIFGQIRLYMTKIMNQIG